MQGSLYFKWSFVEISVKSYICLYFKLWVVITFLNKLGYHMPCEFLDGAWKIEIHSRTCDGYHVSISPGQDVTETESKSATKRTYAQAVHLQNLQSINVTILSQIHQL